MTDFDYDVLQKKRLARNAQKKKNGSRSKKVTLPSDYLSPGAKKNMNGVVRVYKMGQKISWEEFKSYPVDKQKEYMESMVEKFGCTRGMFVEMWGVAPATIGTHINKRPELRNIMRQGASKVTVMNFSEWLKSQSEESPVVEAPPPVIEPSKPKTIVIDSKFSNVASAGKLILSGKASDMFQSLAMVFSGAELEVTLHFRVIKDGVVIDETEES